MGSQTHSVNPKHSDVDLANVRALMFALISICMFCLSILFGPDKDILPADGNLLIPIANVKIARGSFLYFAPILIIFISLYTYLFLFRILLNLKEGKGYSDKYIFTMNSPVARRTTYGIFFWFPALVLFGFVYKALPRPESIHVLGIALIFLISIISLQLSLHLHQKYFWVLTMSTLGFVAIILSGYVGVGPANFRWLTSVHGALHKLRPLTLVKVDLKEKDLRGVNISNANAKSIKLKDARLDDAILNGAILTEANLEGADLLNAKLICATLEEAKMQKANLSRAELGGANLKKADLRRAILKKTDFYGASRQDKCGHSYLEGANLEDADLKGAVLTEANLSKSSLVGADLTTFNEGTDDSRVTEIKRAIAIKADFDLALLSMSNLYRADLRCSTFFEADLTGVTLEDATLGGTSFLGAFLNNANLDGADFSKFNCSNNCVEACIECSAIGGMETQAISVKVKNTNDVPGVANDEDWATVNAIENQTSVTTVTPSNVHVPADRLTFTISEGEDAELFTLNSSTGVLTFITAPDFETPTDANADGVYEVTVEVGDAQGKCKTCKTCETGQAAKNEFKKHSDLSKAKLKDANLQDVNLSDATLTGADLRGADLEEANLVGATLDQANLQGADLKNANLEGATLDGANLFFANLTSVKGLSCETLQTAKYWKTTFRDEGPEPEGLECGEKYLIFEDFKDIDKEIFSKFFLRHEDDEGFLREKMRGARMIDIDLGGFDLRKVKFPAVQLDKTDLSDADFTLANLQKATLRKAVVNGTVFTGADLGGADLRGVLELTCKQLKMATNWEKAIRDIPCGAAIPPKPKAKAQHR